MCIYYCIFLLNVLVYTKYTIKCARIMGSVSLWTLKQGQMKSKLSVYQTIGMSTLIFDSLKYFLLALSYLNIIQSCMQLESLYFVGCLCKTISLLTVHSQLIGYSIQSKYLLFFKIKPSLSIVWQTCILLYRNNHKVSLRRVILSYQF